MLYLYFDCFSLLSKHHFLSIHYPPPPRALFRWIHFVCLPGHQYNTLPGRLPPRALFRWIPFVCLPGHQYNTLPGRWWQSERHHSILDIRLNFIPIDSCSRNPRWPPMMKALFFPSCSERPVLPQDVSFENWLSQRTVQRIAKIVHRPMLTLLVWFVNQKKKKIHLPQNKNNDYNNTNKNKINYNLNYNKINKQNKITHLLLLEKRCTFLKWNTLPLPL